MERQSRVSACFAEGKYSVTWIAYNHAGSLAAARRFLSFVV